MKLLFLCLLFLSLDSASASVLGDAAMGFLTQLATVLNTINQVNESAALQIIRDVFPGEVALENQVNNALGTLDDAMNYAVEMGYPMEYHWVTTDDGYILGMQHIPHGKNNTAPTKQTVLLMHGVYCTSEIFLGNLENSYAFALADAGYDVWLGNLRGNKYSRNHTTLSPLLPTFWNISVQQHGEHDVPAMIDYVLGVTGQEKLHYLGYSLGGASMLVCLSYNTKYNDKVYGFLGVAPGFPPKYTNALGFAMLRGLILAAGEFVTTIEQGKIEILPNNKVTKELILRLGMADPEVYRIISSVLTGMELGGIITNVTRLPLYFTQAPLAGMSLRELWHVLQVKRNGFYRYDEGLLNFAVYGQAEPPKYDLGKITAPLAVFWSNFDALIDPLDMALMMKDCKSVIIEEEMNMMSHVGLYYARTNPQLMFPKFIQTFDRFMEVQSAATG